MAFPPKYLESADRQTLCLPGPEPGVAIHGGEEGFSWRLQRYYSNVESVAIERLLKLKEELNRADTETFWTRLMEGMTEICNAQYGFVAKRILRDDHDTAVEMPPIGASGSCLIGTAFYYNDGKDTKAMLRDYKYMAFGAPCGYMKHDKVFVIPEKLQDFVLDNPNLLPFPAEAYIGVPLFFEEKCFAHFGMMWTKDALEARQLSWGFVEMAMHALEDLVLERLLKGASFARIKPSVPAERVKKVIPQEAVTASQSLKPYARSLSHELRTPMQGVVGMLDVMHATVQEAIEGQNNPKIRNVFQELRDNIQAVQDSSRRAVEAADNVVHAYDMNMQIPETPQDGDDFNLFTKASSMDSIDTRPSIFIEGHNIAVNPYKRRRSSPVAWQCDSTPINRHLTDSPGLISPFSADATMEGADGINPCPGTPAVNSPDRRPSVSKTPIERDTYLPPSTKQSKIRDILHLVINDGLLVGGRPDSAIAEQTETGEKIEVRSRSSNGDAAAKSITWSVDDDVPEVLPVDERELTKLISCVFLNAIKFTEHGAIEIRADVPDSGRCVLVKVADTGTGIPKEFLPHLFKPFSREDDSTTRTKEGLGLGLLVAKGLARKIGGDIHCVRSVTSGPDHGTEFEIKIPLSPTDSISRCQSPFTGSPTISRTGQTESESAEKKRSLFRDPKSRNGTKSISPARTSPLGSQDNREPLSSTAPDGAGKAAHRRLSSAGSKMLPPKTPTFDRKLAEKHPLTFLVAEDNKINRRLLVTMLQKLGYKDVYEAFDGREAVRIMSEVYDSASGRVSSPAKRTSSRTVKPGSGSRRPVDVILMDLWMPEMDGYEATEKILEMAQTHAKHKHWPEELPVPTVLAVTADVTDEALLRATQTGMEGFMTKPYKLNDLQRLIEEFSLRHC